MNKIDIIREPEGVDFVVERVKRTKADIEMVSRAIAHYKATGEKLVIGPTTKKPKASKKEKELITKP
jgi:hypothetical protein